MSRAGRSRWLRERAATRAAAGLPKKRPPRRSHYQTADIRDVVQSQLRDLRVQMDQHRARVVHADWAFDGKRAARERAGFDKQRPEGDP